MATELSAEALADNKIDKAVHGTAAIARELGAPPDRVWAAFADLEVRSRWFRMPGSTGHELDFRPGGGESASGVTEVAGFAERLEWSSRIFDIVERRRLVFAHRLESNGLRRYVSLVTVELEPMGEGTRLDYTEQYTVTAFADADGSQDAAHLKGTLPFLLNRLEAALKADASRGG